jgi:hypothetical protein
MKKRFGELAIGARFCYRAHRYEKMTPAVGRHEENGGSVFHPSTEVVTLAIDPSAFPTPPQDGCPNLGNRVAERGPIPNGRGVGSKARIAALVWKERRDRLPSEEQRAAALEMLRQFCPRHRPLPDGWRGTYSNDSGTSERENYGTGN